MNTMFFLEISLNLIDLLSTEAQLLKPLVVCSALQGLMVVFEEHILLIPIFKTVASI